MRVQEGRPALWSSSFHRDFDQINLRFYVQRRQGNELRRGVAFVREIVPRRALATIARGLYNEQYVTRPTSHRLERNEASIRAESTRGEWSIDAVMRALFS